MLYLWTEAFLHGSVFYAILLGNKFLSPPSPTSSLSVCHGICRICLLNFLFHAHSFAKYEASDVNLTEVQWCLPLLQVFPCGECLMRYWRVKPGVRVCWESFLCRGPLLLNVRDLETSFISCKSSLKECVSRMGAACLDKELLLASAASIQSVNSCVSICCLWLQQLAGRVGGCLNKS